MSCFAIFNVKRRVSHGTEWGHLHYQSFKIKHPENFIGKFFGLKLIFINMQFNFFINFTKRVIDTLGQLRETGLIFG